MKKFIYYTAVGVLMWVTLVMICALLNVSVFIYFIGCFILGITAVEVGEYFLIKTNEWAKK